MSSSCSHVTTHANRLSEDALVKTQIGLCIYKAKLVRHWTQRKSAETYNRCFVFVPFTFRCQKDPIHTILHWCAYLSCQAYLYTSQTAIQQRFWATTAAPHQNCAPITYNRHYLEHAGLNKPCLSSAPGIPRLCNALLSLLRRFVSPACMYVCANQPVLPYCSRQTVPSRFPQHNLLFYHVAPARMCAGQTVLQQCPRHSPPPLGP